MPSNEITIYLDDKRRVVRALSQKIQHAIGGVSLLLAGLQEFRSPISSHRLEAIPEVVVAAILLGVFVRDLREARREETHAAAEEHGEAHETLEWFDVIAGVMLVLEAGRQTHERGKPIYMHPNFLLGVVTLTLGVFHRQIREWKGRRRYLRLDRSGIAFRRSAFIRFSVAWENVRRIEVSLGTAVIETDTKRRTIDLRRFRNAAAMRDALLARAPVAGRAPTVGDVQPLAP